jgi:putative ABC transport system permease protein
MLIMFAIAFTDFVATSLLVTGLGRRMFNAAAQLQQF